MRYLMIIIMLFALFFVGCDTAEETATTAETGGAGAVDVAEKSADGSLAGVDIETGELPGEGDE